MIAALRERARAIRSDTYALYLACRDPRVPWHAKLVVALVVAYALSPLDLVPDFIPVLGLLDDLVLLPAGIALAARLIPAAVLQDLRARARAVQGARAPGSRAGAALVICVWLLLALALGVAAHRLA